jgi:hypothetical protein
MLSLNRFASNSSVFRPVTTLFSAVAVSASLLLGGCGGGSVDVGVGVDVVVPPPAPVAAFDLILRVNGQLIDAVNVFPNELQKVDIPVGSNFEIASSGPVAWTVVTGKLVVNPLVGGRLVYQGVSVAPKFISNARYAADTEQVGPVPYPVVISFIATSLSDARQIGQIDIALTN